MNSNSLLESSVRFTLIFVSIIGFYFICKYNVFSIDTMSTVVVYLVIIGLANIVGSLIDFYKDIIKILERKDGN